ncbi:MAG: hypothetical protein WC622_16980 [Pedobacter sp.]|jgi:hypothetical protein|uniref:hypothetical protein n=1 Tax=Pedobacter sp. TaxID=1411316 RepID=UPI0035653F79
MGEYTGKRYQPSNGTEGEGFMGEFCDQCMHEKFCHTQNHDDAQCPILNKSLLDGDVKEWIYDENDKPTCTSFIKWDWGNDEDGWNEPPYNHPINDPPNQLTMPLGLFEEVNELVKA